MLAFHVDRFARLDVGDVLGGAEISSTLPQSLETRADLDFVSSLTPFGAGHLFGRVFIDTTPSGNTDQECELIFELVRRLEFPSLPSRYTHVFAVDTPVAARQLLAGWATEFPSARIVEVEGRRRGRYDAELLDLSGTAWEVWERCRAYWRGEASAQPNWEVLLEPPAVVRFVWR